MATPDDIKARAAQATSAAELATLAREAAPVDAALAKSLLEQAEGRCQMPPDYIAAAEGAVAVGLADYAADLYGQAEDACFDPLELAALGASLARTGTDADKGRALLEQAAGQASKPNELIALAGLAQEALGDEALAARLLAKVEEKAKTLADYVTLAKTLSTEGAVDAARRLYAKGARHCDDLAATVTYAKGWQEVFGDAAAAAKVLADAETDCQFPKDFAALAAGVKDLTGDEAKVAELMEQAAEFAMSGEEHLDLARGYWGLLGDRERAVGAFEKALPDVNDKGQLLELAGFIATQVGAADLAKSFYAKAESKMSAAPERLKLAEAVLADTGDKTLAAAVYARAAEALTQPNDLMSVAANVADRLGDPAAAGAIYRKAFGALSDLNQHFKLVEDVHGKLGDAGFAREVLARAGTLASGSPELLDVAKRTVAVLGDREAARPALAAAEEQVTSVGEMKAVVAAIREHFGDDADWISVVDDKLARREANQEKYAVFQEREKKAASSVKTMQLADDVMAELEDRFYAKKLLVDAQKRIDDEGFDFSKVRRLAAGVGRHLQDGDWARRLIEDAAARMQGFAGVATVAESAAELLPDRAAATAVVRALLDGWAGGLAGRDASPYDWSKLAAVRGRLTGDADTAAAELDRAVAAADAAGAGALTYAELARVAAALGRDERVRALLDAARSRCGSAADARALAARLLDEGFGRDTVAQVYADLKGGLADPRERLAWAEAIVDLFRDRAWAARELTALEQEADAALKPAVRKARQRRAAAAHG